MSFIRYGQDGTYIDIPTGSQYYLYGDSGGIGGWDYDEFAGILFSVAEEIIDDNDYRNDIRDAFIDYFGGITEPERGGIARPERAEIFCQCIDRRFDTVELRDEVHEVIQEEFTAETTECPYCETEVRSDTRLPEEPICNSEDCEDHLWADSFGISVEDYCEIKDYNEDEFEAAVETLLNEDTEEDAQA